MKFAKPKVLILSSGNSCRGQMAEAFLKSFDEKMIVLSAGTKAVKKVNPAAILVMKEAGFNISRKKTKNVKRLLDRDFDFVITVCSKVKEKFPAFSGKMKNRFHIAFDDPASVKGSEEVILHEYRRVRNEIKEKFFKFYLEHFKKY